MTVSIAVTNRASISTWKNVPRIAKKPTTTITSWTSATRAVTPNFTSRNRYVIQSRMPSAPTTMRISACWTRSELTTGPIVVSDRCDSIGPRASSRATTISPSLPSVGSSVLPVTTGGDAPGEAPGEAPGLAAADGAGLADGAGVGLGLADVAGLPLGAAEPGAADPDGAADGAPTGLPRTTRLRGWRTGRVSEAESATVAPRSGRSARS